MSNIESKSTPIVEIFREHAFAQGYYDVYYGWYFRSTSELKRMFPREHEISSSYLYEQGRHIAVEAIRMQLPFIEPDQYKNIRTAKYKSTSEYVILYLAARRSNDYLKDPALFYKISDKEFVEKYRKYFPKNYRLQPEITTRDIRKMEKSKEIFKSYA